MPRADRFSLTSADLTMPSVDHLSNNGMLNVLLDRTFRGQLSGVPLDRTMVGLFTNFARLTDKALREYDAARAELHSYVAGNVGHRVSPYLRAIDHMENCVSATHRAVLNAEVLRKSKVGRAGPRLTQNQRDHLIQVRHAIEHSDEKLRRVTHGKSPAFHESDPYSLRLANTSMTIGQHVLTYRQLVSAMTKCHATIEVIRGVPTGAPGSTFPNAKLRTTVPRREAAPSLVTMHPSEYLGELSRLVVTHS